MATGDQETSEPIVAEAVAVAGEPATAAGSPALARGAFAGSPPGGRELLGVALLVALCDITIYRGQGLAGYALLFAAGPLLLAWAVPRPRWGSGSVCTGSMLLVLSARLVWWGSGWNVAYGFALLVAFTLTISGQRPFVPDVFVRAVQAIPAAPLGLAAYARGVATGSRLPAGLRWSRWWWLSILLPIAAFAAFGLLFLLANPDLLASVNRGFDHLLARLSDWLAGWSPEPGEIVFCGVVLWIVVGLLRPIVRDPVWDTIAGDGLDSKLPVSESRLFAACRNTLWTVIVLFAAYLVFEFRTLWFREFPVGFYYAGYAHQGAAWLTVALALSTATLSFIFRGILLRDPRLPQLRRLAWVWSAENLVLAAAVYNRLAIYIRFNGLTQMRMVGLFGISVVVAGFLLVLWKIARNRSFHWLIQRQLWALAVTVFLYGVTPVDAIVFRHNARRVLAGDLAPSVQISVQSINAEGLPQLLPLLDCPDPAIREGVRALLSLRTEQAERQLAERRRKGWTAFQAAERSALARLRAHRERWADYRDDPQRRTWAIARFDHYVYQWY